jgi:transcriptional regulator with XRE-family HTH domain
MEDNSKLIEDQKQDIIFRIIRARDKANLSARALSQKVGLNDGYINRLESKKDFLPSLDVLLKIINVCGQTPEEFFYDSFDSYKEDIKILNLLKNTSKENKIAIITLL